MDCVEEVFHIAPGSGNGLMDRTCTHVAAVKEEARHVAAATQLASSCWLQEPWVGVDQMVDLSQMPGGSADAVNVIVVPVTGMWFVRWFRLVPDYGKHTRARRK